MHRVPVRTVAHALFVALVLLLLGAPRLDARAGADLSVGRISVEPGAGDAATVGVPVTFRATGSSAGGGEPVFGFLWLFGDGAQTFIDARSGPATRESVVQHAFAQTGRYRVSCYVFRRTQFDPRTGVTRIVDHADELVRVRVLCAGSSPGPKSCPRGPFDVFSGVWRDESGTVTGTFEQVGRDVVGTLAVADSDLGANVTIDLHGRTQAAAVSQSHALVRLAAKATVRETGEKLRVSIRAELLETERDYRVLDVGITRRKGPPLDFSASLLAVPPAAPSSATICTSLASSHASVAPGGQFAVSFQVGSSGPACLPGGRLRARLTVTGARLVPGKPVARSNASRPDEAGDPLLFEIGSLGDDVPVIRGRAAASVLLAADPDAAEVRVFLTITDESDVADGAFAVVTLPPDRQICVGIDSDGTDGN